MVLQPCFSQAEFENTAEISASASVLCRLGHKDDLPAREAALRLASNLILMLP